MKITARRMLKGVRVKKNKFLAFIEMWMNEWLETELTISDKEGNKEVGYNNFELK